MIERSIYKDEIRSLVLTRFESLKIDNEKDAVMISDAKHYYATNSVLTKL